MGATFVYLYRDLTIMGICRLQLPLRNKLEIDEEGFLIITALKVRDVPKLLDDGGEIPKSQGRGWQFNSQL